MILTLMIVICIITFCVLALDVNDIVNLFSGVVAVIATVICTCMIVCAITAHVGVAGTSRLKEEEYKALIFKSQSEAVRDEFGLLNKEFIDEVQEWNKDVASGKAWQHDFWIGIFYPPVYDNLETIDLESMEFKK